MYGAIREDDNPSEDPPTPQDVAPGLNRPLNHFYDPRFNRPLTFPGLTALDPDVHRSPDWAVGSRDSFFDSNTPEFPRRNSFSIIDGREAMFRALTLLAYDGTSYADLSTGADNATRQQWRQAYWATTFRALGDVLHLNQDMAQPQHTRNEPHSGKVCPSSKICLGGHTSIFEKYINARALLQRAFNAGSPTGTAVDIAIRPLTLGAYPIPSFARYTDYWSTAPGDPSAPGRGLSDYSNRGFFSAAKNFGSAEYPSPSSNPSDYSVVSFVPSRWDGSPSADPTPAHVYYGRVADAWQQTIAESVPMTTYGVWDQFLLAQAATPAYTLNRLNYDAMADLLLPRAAAYSAGLINFFFRGRLDIALPDEGVFALADHSSEKGFTIVRAKIRNTTQAFADPEGNAQPQHMSGGQFFAVLRYHRDRQYAASLDTVVGAPPCAVASAVVDAARLDASTACRDGVEQIVVSRPLYGVSLDANAQKAVEFEFVDSPIPFDIVDVVLQVVYRGEIGTESDAVAVGTIDASEPTYFTYQNASDYIHLGDHVYTRSQIESDINLLALVQPQYCVDYRQSPPHLVSWCLNPFSLDLAVSFGDLTRPIAAITDLPARRFLRLVYLTTADDSFNPPVASKAARRAKVAARRHGDGEKALLYQQGTCLPLDPLDAPPRHSQLTVLSPTQANYRVDPLSKLRGVNGWYNVSCVQNGDSAMPGTPDDRISVMTPLAPGTEEVQPFEVTIMAEFL